MDLETQTPIGLEKEKNPNTEQVKVTMLNTSFGDALKNSETLERILPTPNDQLAVVGFSEVTPGVRDGVVAAIEKQGYNPIIPDGEGKNIDIIWAVSPKLRIRQSIAHRFKGKVESRPGGRHRRDAGTFIIEAVTPNDRVLRLSSERFAPPLRGESARRLHMLGMAAVLDSLDTDDASVDIDISGGDHNKANGPTEADKKMWQDKGYTPVVKEGEATYNLKAAGRIARAAGKALQLMGRFPTMEFDKMYARPGKGRELVRIDSDEDVKDLSANQVGYTLAKIISVDATDHAAIETIISLSPKNRI